MKSPETNPQNHLTSDEHAIIIWEQGSFFFSQLKNAESIVYGKNEPVSYLIHKNQFQVDQRPKYGR